MYRCALPKGPVRSASSGSAAARSIRLALRASSIVATSSDSFARCVLRCRGRNCSNSALMLSARRSIPVIGRVLAPPKAESLNHTPVHRVNNPSHQTDGWQGLRGLAALGIVIYHYKHFNALPLEMLLFPLYDSGDFLVDFFFV